MHMFLFTIDLFSKIWFNKSLNLTVHP